MKMTKWIVMAMTGLMLTAGSAMAQDQGGAGGGGGPGGAGGGRGGGRGNFDPAQFQKMMTDRIKQHLEVSDEDWKAIEPLVAEVQKQQMAYRMSSRGGMFGGRGGRGGPGGGAAGGAGAAPAEVTPATELAKVLENKNATPEEIKAKVDAFRAKQKANKEALAKAQEDLRQVLTARQEATLILDGTLE
jgi:Spy/CpxP family protein refolding chaperone